MMETTIGTLNDNYIKDVIFWGLSVNFLRV